MRNGDWIQTASGGVFWPIDPRPDEVDIVDIAHALSNMCRYAGHCRKFYSVAQHSVLVSDNLPHHLKLWGLLHDAAEAYVVDVPSPLKSSLVGYKEIEMRVMDSIVSKFNLLPFNMPSDVKSVDDAILHDEMDQLMGSPAMPWNLSGKRLGITIDPLPPIEAKELFLSRFYELTK